MEQDIYTFTKDDLQRFIIDFAKYFGLEVSDKAYRAFIVDTLGPEHA